MLGICGEHGGDPKLKFMNRVYQKILFKSFLIFRHFIKNSHLN